ncbi:MAG TPA: HEAT repeat domain-containing protein [Gemmataceae bacterium]|jgi:hypothetical protein|nr:HEAT repeat domain-containing protein [Gemmataceae bacterium]
MRATILLIAIATFATAAPKPGDAGTPEFDKATALVKQLGHPRFASREAAAKQILDMGGAAVPALLAGIKSDDEEIRNRSTTLLPQAKAADWRRRAEAYLADKEGKEKHDLPLLDAWEKQTGKPDAGTRKLFAEMVRTSGEFLEEAAGPKSASVLGKRCTLLRDRLRTGSGQIKAEPGELAAVFFVEAHAASSRSPGTRRSGPRPAAAPLLANPIWPEALDAADTGPVLRKLLVRWVESRAIQESARQQFAALVRKKPFPEAAAPLARLAKDKKADVFSVRVLAIEALGKVGGSEATAALTELLADTSAIFGQGENEHQICDAALAALVTMTGKNLGAYELDSNTSIGFATDEDDEEINIRIYGFRSSDARKKAIQKWKEETAPKKDEPTKKK